MPDGGTGAPVVIVGRDAELAVLREALHSLAAGRGGSVVVEGEPGIGKTSLLDAALADAPDTVRIHRGSGVDLHRERPFGTLAVAFGVSPGADDVGRRRMAEQLRAPGTDDDGTAAPWRYRMIDGFERLAERDALVAPTAIVVDDAQWCDPGSVRALDVLLERDDLPLLIVMASRFGPRPREVDKVLDEAARRGCRMTLGALGATALLDLARIRLRATPGPVLQQHLQATAGHPLYASELVDGFVTAGAVHTDGGLADVDTDIAVPMSLHRAILDRLSFLSPPAIALLRTAAALGSRFTPIDLAAVADAPAPEVLAALEEAMAGGVVFDAGPGVCWRHDLVREALYEETAPSLRPALHRHIAATLRRAGASAADVSTHLLLGATRGDADTIGLLEDAAATLAATAPEVAIELLQRIAELVDDDQHRIAVLTDVVRLLVVTGDARGAAALVDELGRRAAGTPAAAQVEHVRLPLLIVQSRAADLRETAQRLLGDPSLTPGGVADVQVFAAAGHILLGDVAGTGTALAAARAAIEAEPVSQTAALYHRVEGVRASIEGRPRDAVAAYERAVAASATSSGGRGMDLVYLGGALLLADRLAEAGAAMEAGRAQLQRTGRHQFLVDHHWFLGNLHLAEGRWDDALAELETADRLAGRTGALGPGIRTVPDPRPLVHLFRNDIAMAAEAAAAIEAQARGMLLVEHWFGPIRALVAEATGDDTAAICAVEGWLAALDDLGAVADLRGVGAQLARLVRRRGSEQLVAAVADAAARARDAASGTASIEGASMLVTGVLRDDRALVEQSVELCRRGGRVLDIAQACAAAGLAALVGGDDRGRGLLADAVASFETLGASRLEAALAAEARALGLRRGSRRPHRPARHGWESLTETELLVVTLVVEGQTNAEIGARLFISRGTVATHLRNVFRKLGMSSRAEVAAEAVRRATADRERGSSDR